MKYYVNWQTGKEREYIGISLTEAMFIADQKAGYTGTGYRIEYEDGTIVAKRPFYAYEFDAENDEDQNPYEIISFGKYGFFGNWVLY